MRVENLKAPFRRSPLQATVCSILVVSHVADDRFHVEIISRIFRLILRAIASFTEKENKKRILMLLEFLGTCGTEDKILQNMFEVKCTLQQELTASLVLCSNCNELTNVNIYS